MNLDMRLRNQGRREHEFIIDARTFLWRLVLITCLLACLTMGSAWGQFRGFKTDFVDPAMLTDINFQTGALSIPPDFANCNFSPPHTAFFGFTSGLAVMDNRLYGLVWDASSNIFLNTIRNDDPLSPGCALAQPVGSMVGFPNLESLEYFNGSFWTVDFDFESHLARLIRVDPLTGIGSVIGGPMGFNVRVGGLAYDSVTDTLYALTLGFGGSSGRFPELLTINYNTGMETLIGPTGTPSDMLQSLGIDSSGRLFAAGADLYEISRTTGTTTMVASDNFSGSIYGLTLYPTQSGVDPAPDVKINDSDGPVVTLAGGEISATLTLNTGSFAEADWWVAASTPTGWYYFDPIQLSWVFVGSSHTDLLVSHQGPLFELAPFKLDLLSLAGPSPVSSLPTGVYTIYFGVDTARNGILDLSQLFFDFVELTVQ